MAAEAKAHRLAEAEAGMHSQPASHAAEQERKQIWAIGSVLTKPSVLKKPSVR